MKRTLHPHQQTAMDILRQSLRAGHKRPMMQAPTGFGKTVLAGAIIDSALSRRKRIIVTVPAISLIDQTVGSFFREGIYDVGVLQGNHPMTNLNAPVQVASVQTLRRRKIPKADIVLIDEAHRWFDFYSKWINDPEWASVPFIGLSATPWTKGLGKHFDDLIIAATTLELIENGFLSPFRVFAPSSGLKPDLSQVQVVAGDWHEGQLAEAMRKPVLVADVVQTWLDKAEGRPTLCFAVDRAHARDLQERFQRTGISAEYVDAFTSRDERESIRKRFHSGEVQVVCNVGCLTTGVDWDVRCIVLARPTKSEMLYCQIIGRGLRTAPGKTDCLILDHSDTTVRLGFVTDIHHEHLDDGKLSRAKQKAKEEGERPLPKECLNCGLIRPASARKCPHCGFEAKPVSKTKHAAGQLEEITSGKIKADKSTKQKWYSMLRYIASERGYKSGWAANQYRSKFGVWPSRLEEISTRPDAEVLGFVLSRQIAYAKQRANAAPETRVAA